MNNTMIKNIITNPKKTSESMSVKDLISALKYFSIKYYEGNELISDDTFDYLLNVLKKKDPKNKYLNEIGYKIKNKNEIIKLKYPLASLNKIKNDQIKELDNWLNKYKGPYIISDKLDGNSALLVVNNNIKKINLYTRGDETSGKDISDIVPFIFPKSTIKKLLSKKNNIVLRGELIISKENFEKIKNIKNYKNARNGIAGILNNKKKDYDVCKFIDFIVYEIINPVFLNKQIQLEKLKKIDVKIVEWEKINNLSIDILEKKLLERKKKSKYEIDGIVITDNTIEKYKNTKTNPKHSIAFKMQLNEQIKESTVIDVIWESSMYGYLIPVIIIEPININNVTINRVTGNNAYFIVNNKIGPGAIVSVLRSGDVIPKIIEIVKESDNIKMPDIEYIWDDSKVHIISKNNNKEIKIKSLHYFLTSLKIKYFGSSMVEKFIDIGYDTKIKLLTFKVEDVLNKFKQLEIKGIGENIILKLRNSVDNSIKNATLANYMDGSLIFGRGFGYLRSELIINKYPNIFESFFIKNIKNVEKYIYDKVIIIDGFGEIITEQFSKKYLDFVKFYNLLKKNNILKSSTVNKVNVVNKKGKLSNLIIVFTEVRNDELKKKIIKEGGLVRTKLSDKTNILIYKKGDSSSYTKAIEMKKNGFKINLYTIEEFINKYFKD